MQDVTAGRYLGLAMVGGQRCHHLAYRGAEVDWQIWIHEGSQPAPCRYVITSKAVAGAPQFSVQIVKWDTSAKVDAGKFRFAPPAGARPVDSCHKASRADTQGVHHENLCPASRHWFGPAAGGIRVRPLAGRCRVHWRRAGHHRNAEDAGQCCWRCTAHGGAYNGSRHNRGGRILGGSSVGRIGAGGSGIVAGRSSAGGSREATSSGSCRGGGSAPARDRGRVLCPAGVFRHP